MQLSNYPPSPSCIDTKALNPTKEYKYEVLKVSGAITLFIIVYICLVLLSGGLAALVTFLGLELIIIKPMFMTIIAGIGLIGLGIMVIYFLIKFIFAIKKYDRSGLYEIKEKEHPDLYSFIRQLTKETKTPMPKHIYLSPDVNACVFYDSSFLSMFFPVRKNLLIGLGLVNSVNMSEFKAVIAHEFGHFSQHSMKLGAYVFNVNKMIHNMLYDNDGYYNMLNRWSSVSGYFTIFVALTVKIVKGMQWILQKVYKVVNKSNLRLSRQMEHHADSVSAYVTGPNHLASALRRIELADTSYNALLDNWSNWISDNIKPINLYECHREIIAHHANELEVPLVHGLPVIETSPAKNKSRVVIKNEWATHPGNDDRELYLKSLNIPATSVVDESPWSLFNSVEVLQEKITAKLFSNVRYEGDCQSIDLVAFKEKYYSGLKGYSFNKKYKGYYDNRRIVPLDIDSLKPDSKHQGFDELFSDENCMLPKDSTSLNADLQTLLALQSKQYDVKTFDFDGKNYSLKDIPALMNPLNAENVALQDKMNA
jgi:Zn-dependent protease with chaperone function